MMNLRKGILTSAILMSLQGHTANAPQADIAILLDTSGSMQGLINQVRDGLWQTLNNLGRVTKDGLDANVRLALYEYGSGVVPEETGFIQLLTPLTTDHTLLAGKLFATEAKGGSEYSGLAISRATTDLKWGELTSDFKSIILAGNETLFQGPVDPFVATSEAVGKGIIVNTVFAGPETLSTGNGGGFGNGCAFCPLPTTPNPPVQTDPVPNSIFLEWKKLATDGLGASLSIDSNQSLPYVESPFDGEIIKLTEAINTTFLPFGPNGQSEFERMINLDRQIRSSGAGTYMDWGSYQGGHFGQLNQSTWDLVSASKVEGFDITLIKETDLPKDMQGESVFEKLEIIRTQRDKRDVLQGNIDALQVKRAEFVAEVHRQNQTDGQKTFADAIKGVIISQLKDAGFTLTGPKK
ncbi:MAG: hypothetical protein K9K67_13240 [Bacteriovoracaceae bacterium]|nr:hypothetical protein [Bacteriovoracaceae bacterium]